MLAFDAANTLAPRIRMSSLPPRRRPGTNQLSRHASEYIRDLRTCPNGERITPIEKCLAMILADYYSEENGCFASVATLAEDASIDHRRARRVLSSLESKGVIVRTRPVSQGRGHLTTYLFPGLQKGGTIAPLTVTEGGPISPPLFEKGGSEGGYKGGQKPTAHNRRNNEQGTTAKGRIAEEILEIWNDNCGDSLPRAQKLTSSRREKLRTRISEAESPESYIADFTDAVRLCATTAFLKGKGDRQWKATFEWLIKNDGNMVGVLEGKYGKPDKPEGLTLADSRAKMNEQLRNMGVPDAAIIQGVAV
jgi:hypothetical protein